MKRKKIVAVVALVVLLALLFLVFNLPNRNPKQSFEEGRVNVSTNKTPLFEKAPYPVMDFFSNQENVTLFAGVSDGDSPVPNTLVSLQISGPSNPFENVTFQETVWTNSSGVGSLKFLVPSPIENHAEVVFGNWTVTAQTRLGEDVVSDTTIFRVSWPVEILSVKTVDANRSPRVYFTKKGDVGVEITLRNNNAVPVSVVIKGNVRDNRSQPVGDFSLEDLEIPPGAINTIYCRLVLNDYLTIITGWATLHVNAYDEQGAPYCPAASTKLFLRIGDQPVYILTQDVVLVDFSSSRSEIDVGENVEISTVVRNSGTEVENLTVVIYDNEFPITTLKVNRLLPNTERTVHFVWNTTKASEGKHSVRALATIVPWETSLNDNTSPARTVTLSIRPPPPSKEDASRSLFIIMLLTLLLFLVTAIGAAVYRRRKEKPFEPTEFTFTFLE